MNPTDKLAEEIQSAYTLGYGPFGKPGVQNELDGFKAVAEYAKVRETMIIQELLGVIKELMESCAHDEFGVRDDVCETCVKGKAALSKFGVKP